MRRLPSLLLTFPALFVAGWSLQVVAIVMRYDYINEGHLRSSAIQVLIWLVTIVPAFFVLEVILRRSRSAITEAAAIALLCIACALAGQVVYGLFAWSHRWYHRGDYDFFLLDRPLPTALRLATRRPEAAILVAVCALLIGRFLLAGRQEREQKLREKRLETRLSMARLQLLQSQLQPHFLFNALNSAMALVRHDPSGAELMLARLSRFYSITVQTDGRTLIPLSDELAFVREYLDIEQIRFGARLTVAIDAADDVLAVHVPALLLQPLVENAIRHGAARTPGPVWIRLKLRRIGGKVSIEIANRGGFEQGREGLGLSNTRARLRETFGDASTLTIEPERDLTRVTIALPLARTTTEAA